MGRRGNTTGRGQMREGGREAGRKGGKEERGTGAGNGRDGKDVYAESKSARRATFIGAWMYDDDCCQLRCVTMVLIL